MAHAIEIIMTAAERSRRHRELLDPFEVRLAQCGFWGFGLRHNRELARAKERAAARAAEDEMYGGGVAEKFTPEQYAIVWAIIRAIGVDEARRRLAVPCDDEEEGVAL